VTFADFEHLWHVDFPTLAPVTVNMYSVLKWLHVLDRFQTTRIPRYTSMDKSRIPRDTTLFAVHVTSFLELYVGVNLPKHLLTWYLIGLLQAYF